MQFGADSCVCDSGLCAHFQQLQHEWARAQSSQRQVRKWDNKSMPRHYLGLKNTLWRYGDGRYAENVFFKQSELQCFHKWRGKAEEWHFFQPMSVSTRQIIWRLVYRMENVEGWMFLEGAIAFLTEAPLKKTLTPSLETETLSGRMICR